LRVMFPIRRGTDPVIQTRSPRKARKALQITISKRSLWPAARSNEVIRNRADATRLMLAAALLKASELCVGDLAWIAEPSQTIVSHHVRALRAHGVVRSRRQGKMVTSFRPARHGPKTSAIRRSSRTCPRRPSARSPESRTRGSPAGSRRASGCLLLISRD